MPVAPFRSDDALKSFVTSQSKQNTRIMRIVFDDEKCGVSIPDIVSVVVDLRFARNR